MCSTRSGSGAAGLMMSVICLGLISIGAGCKRGYQYPAEPVGELDNTDPAIKLRNWPETEMPMANLSLRAGVTHFPYEHQTIEQNPPNRSYWLDTAAFLGQTIALPFTYIRTPPFTQRTYHPVSYNGTFTAIPSYGAAEASPATPAAVTPVQAPAEPNVGPQPPAPTDPNGLPQQQPPANPAGGSIVPPITPDPTPRAGEKQP